MPFLLNNLKTHFLIFLFILPILSLHVHALLFLCQLSFEHQGPLQFLVRPDLIVKSVDNIIKLEKHKLNRKGGKGAVFPQTWLAGTKPASATETSRLCQHRWTREIQTLLHELRMRVTCAQQTNRMFCSQTVFTRYRTKVFSFNMLSFWFST